MASAGKWIVLVMVALGITAGAGSVAYHRSISRRAVEFWGADTASLIHNAPTVKLLRLEPASSETPRREVFNYRGEMWAVVSTSDISQARGLVHARKALVEDAQLKWDPPQVSSVRWAWALQFSDGSKSAVVLLGRDFEQIAQPGGTKQISLRRPIALELRKILALPSGKA